MSFNVPRYAIEKFKEMYMHSNINNLFHFRRHYKL